MSHEETAKDEEWKMLGRYINEGWPNQKSLVPSIIKQYYNSADELTIIQGLIFKGMKLVVPERLRPAMLKKIHYNHLGMEQCRSRAREILYWPLMNKEIEDMVSSCNICAKYRKGNNREYLMPREVPEGPCKR